MYVPAVELSEAAEMLGTRCDEDPGLEMDMEGRCTPVPTPFPRPGSVKPFC